MTTSGDSIKPIPKDSLPARSGWGRAAASMTYDRVDSLARVVERVDLKLDLMSNQQEEIKRLHEGVQKDHEARLRILENSVISRTASIKTALWVFVAVWPVAGVVISVLNHLDATP